MGWNHLAENRRTNISRLRGPEPIWVTLFAKALEGKNMKELLSGISAGRGAPPVGASGPAATSGGGAAAPEAAKEEKEESDDDMGLGLFD